MAMYPTVYRLPLHYNTEIGRIITRFAFLESRLRVIAYLLLNLSPKEGRLAVRLGRIGDAISIIQRLLALQSFTTTQNLDKLSTECKKMERFRDRLAHGIWAKHPGAKTPVLQVTSGSYALSQGGESISAKINPQAVAVQITDFRNQLRGIEIALNTIATLGHEIDAQRRASLDKQNAQSTKGPSRRSRRSGQTTTERKRPH